MSRLMKMTLAFHDIGKSIAYRTGDKSREVRYSNPLAQDLLRAAGFNSAEVRLGVSLISAHQVIGRFLQDPKTTAQTLREIRKAAAYAQMDRPDFFRLLEVVFICDAGSYPALYVNVFERAVDGRIRPRGRDYQELRGHFFLKKIETKNEN